jgi:hypothetical protein
MRRRVSFKSRRPAPANLRPTRILRDDKRVRRGMLPDQYRRPDVKLALARN